MQPGLSQMPDLQKYEQNTMVVLRHNVLGNLLQSKSNHNVPSEKCLPDWDVKEKRNSSETLSGSTLQQTQTP